MEISKQDWKLFMEKIGQWLESYMDKLTKEYAEMLMGSGGASDKFWALDERIKEDKKKPGVQLRLSKPDTDLHIAMLIKDGVIGFADLKDFSEELQERCRNLMRLWNE